MENINGLRTWIEVDKAAIKRNYSAFRQRIGAKCRLMAVVKSNGYGHDLVTFSRLIASLDADWLGADSVTEAAALRRAGIKKPLLVLGYTLPENFALAARRQISLTVSAAEGLKLLGQKPVRFHLKMDTGMHRQGFLPAELPAILKFLKRQKISPERFEGIYTHFASAQSAGRQLKIFQPLVAGVRRAGFRPLAHAAATAAAALHPETRLDMVRIGLGLYGLWPSPETAVKAGFKLRPALSWKTIISEIKTLPAGSRIGYDGTEQLKRAGRMAICPIGYWHGLPRHLSGRGEVLVRGRRARVLGRVSMDMIAIDLQNSPRARVGDEVTLIGRQGDEEISADELARLAGTSNYEIITRLNPLMKRVYK